MRKIDLSDLWVLHKNGDKSSSYSVNVPSCVHFELLGSQDIMEIFFGTNLKKHAELCYTGWNYCKDFYFDPLEEFELTHLHIEGVLSPAEIFLNAQKIGTIPHILEPIDFDITNLLKQGKNHLEIRFPPYKVPPPAGEFKRQESLFTGVIHPPIPIVGILGYVALFEFSKARISNIQVVQKSLTPQVAHLRIILDCERLNKKETLNIVTRVCYKGSILNETCQPLKADRTALDLSVKNPQIWWPVGLGSQPLYEITVDILAGRISLGHISKRIGIKKIVFRRDKKATDTPGGQFFLNGKPIFLNSATWVPANIFHAKLSRVEYAPLVKAAAMSNINCFRIWGNGVYEPDSFYDLCDEYGICVLQDTHLCELTNSYKPNSEILNLFRQNLTIAIQRLRHHASIIGWVGGDSDAVSKPFREIAEKCVKENHINGVYLDPFPYCYPKRQDSTSLSTPPAYPIPQTIGTYLSKEERNPSHESNLYHSVPSNGQLQIIDGIFKEFLFPSSFEEGIWLSQILQGVTLKRQIQEVRNAPEHFKGAELGFCYWYYNDPWPTCSPSTIDFFARKKAAQFFLRRAYAPSVISAEWDEESETVTIFLWHDALTAFKGEVNWRIIDVEGNILLNGTKKVTPKPCTTLKVTSVKVGRFVKKYSANEIQFWTDLLDSNGNQISWDILPFTKWKDVTTPPPRIHIEIRAWNETNFQITLTSVYPAFWVWIMIQGEEFWIEDNFFCLEPAKPVRIRVTTTNHMRLDQFRQKLCIASLRDTHRKLS